MDEPKNAAGQVDLPEGAGLTRSAPTSNDVARMANVSRATVSYVLNNVQDSRISEATRSRVFDAAARLGYVPYKAARLLRSGHSDLVILPFFDWPYNQASITFLQELSIEVERLGYSVMLRFFRRGDKKTLATKIAESHPVGVIVGADGLSPEDVEILTRNGTKAVLSYEGSPTAFLPTVAVDFATVGELAGHYLQLRGHRHMAVVVPRDERILQFGLQRLAGLERIGKRSGVTIERIDLGFYPGEAAALVAGWAGGPHPSAVFTYNDEYGLLLMSALQDAGMNIPGDIALIGCDNLPICELLRPRLTSIDIAPSGSARDVASYFHRMIQGREQKTPIRLPMDCTIIVRESG